MKNFSSGACRSLIAIVLAAISAPLFAQSTDARTIEERLKDLQAQIEQLKAQADALEKELATGQADVQTDLTDIQPVAPPSEPIEADAAQATPAAGDLPDAVVTQDSPAPSSKILNPDISVIGNFTGHVGEVNPEERDSLALEEVEVALEAFVDPYAKAKFFIAGSEEGVEIEEGYVDFIQLPWGLTSRLGKMKAQFGKINPTHPHSRPWVDQPLVLSEFFGEEGLNDSGISISKIFPSDKIYVEAIGQIFRGEVEDVFERTNQNDLFYLGRLRFYDDLSEESNLELGTSFARGSLADDAGANEFAGVDLTYRWKPLERSIYRSFISRTEFILNDRDDRGDTVSGFYSSADYQFARRWLGGLRYDHTERIEDGGKNRAISGTLSFRPSEFSTIRGQLRHIDFDDIDSGLELLLQVQFSIGAHGAHTF